MPVADAPPREALLLSESITIQEGALNADGTVNLHIIRPGIGKGKGKHLYTPEMLRENAEIFAGWRMYIDHLSDEARRKLGGLPRSIRDLGGRITEAWWDPNVPADPSKGWGQGAVVGKAKPAPIVRDLIEHDPDLIEASISARATNVKAHQHEGQRVWMVEGIEPTGSVDWVTEAGAGGRIATLMESHYDEDEIALLESMSDDALVEHIRAERPDLIEQLTEADDGDGGDAIEGRVKALMKKGLNRRMALRAARREAKEAQEAIDQEEDDDVPVTADALREVFQSDEGKALLDELLEARVAEKLDAKLEEVLPDKIEEALDEERELIRIEANADAQRSIQLRDLRDRAKEMITEAKLPPAFAEVVSKKFTLGEGNKPTPGLDVIEEADDEGKVTKTAMQVLEEAVSAEIAEQRRLLAEANPTRVTSPRKAKPKPTGENTDLEEGRRNDEDEDHTTGSSLTDSLLQRSGFKKESLDKVYG